MKKNRKKIVLIFILVPLSLIAIYLVFSIIILFLYGDSIKETIGAAARVGAWIGTLGISEALIKNRGPEELIVDNLDDPRYKAQYDAEVTAVHVAKAVQMYHRKYDEFPDKAEELLDFLRDLKRFGKFDQRLHYRYIDPWNNSFVIKPLDDKKFLIISLGANGKLDTSDVQIAELKAKPANDFYRFSDDLVLIASLDEQISFADMVRRSPIWLGPRRGGRF